VDDIMTAVDISAVGETIVVESTIAAGIALGTVLVPATGATSLPQLSQATVPRLN
jgi:hypothetical protein